MSLSHKMRDRKIQFFGVIGIQIFILLSIVLYNFVVLLSGASVVFTVEPVDPRDPLRGDYMVLSFKNISRIDSYYFSRWTEDDEDTYFGPDIFEPNIGDTVYVHLQDYSTRYEAIGVYPTKPEGRLFIKGVVTQKIGDPVGSYDVAKYEIEYGIENYFIPENRGEEINFSQNTVEAMVAIDSNGKALLKYLIVDGERWPD